MPSEPTSLRDLRRIDAAVRLRCGACGRDQAFDRELLIGRLGRKPDLPLGEAATWCDKRTCDGVAAYAGPIACSDDPAEVRRRVAAATLVNLACEVLHRSAYERATRREQHAPVRLALRVAHAFGAEARLCTAFWTNVTTIRTEPWHGPQLEFGWIARALVARGHAVNAEYR